MAPKKKTKTRRIIPGSSPEKEVWPDAVFEDIRLERKPSRKISTLQISNGFEDECFLNKSRLESLESWFREGTKNKRILLISGPAGSGKSFAVQYVASKIGTRLRDYLDFQSETHHATVSKTKYQALSFANNHAPPLPTTLVFDNFCSALKTPGLLDGFKQSRLPIILIVTEPVAGEPSVNVWLKDLLSDPTTLHLEFIPFPRTVLTKAIKLALPSLDCPEDLLLGCHGDMRHLMITLKLWHTGNQPLTIEHSLVDQSLHLFHSLGKAIYPRKQPLDFEWLVAEDPELFNTYLHHNFPLCTVTVTNLVEALDAFCLYDMIRNVRHGLMEADFASLPARCLSNITTNRTAVHKRCISMSKPLFMGQYKRSKSKFNHGLF